MDINKTLDLCIEADAVYANGVLYEIDRVDCDEQIIYCFLWTGTPTTITVELLSRSHYVKFYKLEELK